MKNCVVFVAVLLNVCVIVHSALDDGKECEFWKLMTQRINAAQNVNRGNDNYMQCKYHADKCEQFDCTGSIQSSIFTVWNFTYCWGVIVNHCDDPISMDIYLQIQSRGIKVTRRIYHNTEIPIPQLTFNRTGTNVGVVLAFEMQKNANRTITFKVTVKTSYTVFGVVIHPPALQKEVIPETVLPVSKCSNVTKTPNITLGKCGVVENHDKNPVIVRPTQIVNITSASYHKPCQTAVLPNICHFTTEICKQKNETDSMGICECDIGLLMCPYTGYCSNTEDCINQRLPPLQPATPVATAAPHSQTGGTTKKSAVNSTAVIIGSVCGGIVLLVIAAVVVVYFLKRRGTQYRGRQLLLTEDDTDGII